MCPRRHAADDDDDGRGLADQLARWDTAQSWMRLTPEQQPSEPGRLPPPPADDDWDAVLSAESAGSTSDDPWARDDSDQDVWVPSEPDPRATWSPPPGPPQAGPPHSGPSPSGYPSSGPSPSDRPHAGPPYSGPSSSGPSPSGYPSSGPSPSDRPHAGPPYSGPSSSGPPPSGYPSSGPPPSGYPSSGYPSSGEGWPAPDPRGNWPGADQPSRAEQSAAAESLEELSDEDWLARLRGAGPDQEPLPLEEPRAQSPWQPPTEGAQPWTGGPPPWQPHQAHGPDQWNRPDTPPTWGRPGPTSAASWSPASEAPQADDPTRWNNPDPATTWEAPAWDRPDQPAAEAGTWDRTAQWDRPDQPGPEQPGPGTRDEPAPSDFADQWPHGAGRPAPQSWDREPDRFAAGSWDRAADQAAAPSWDREADQPAPQSWDRQADQLAAPSRDRQADQHAAPSWEREADQAAPPSWDRQADQAAPQSWERAVGQSDAGSWDDRPGAETWDRAGASTSTWDQEDQAAQPARYDERAPVGDQPWESALTEAEQTETEGSTAMPDRVEQDDAELDASTTGDSPNGSTSAVTSEATWDRADRPAAATEDDRDEEPLSADGSDDADRDEPAASESVTDDGSRPTARTDDEQSLDSAEDEPEAPAAAADGERSEGGIAGSDDGWPENATASDREATEDDGRELEAPASEGGNDSWSAEDGPSGGELEADRDDVSDDRADAAWAEADRADGRPGDEWAESEAPATTGDRTDDQTGGPAPQVPFDRPAATWDQPGEAGAVEQVPSDRPATTWDAPGETGAAGQVPFDRPASWDAPAETCGEAAQVPFDRPAATTWDAPDAQWGGGEPAAPGRDERSDPEATTTWERTAGEPAATWDRAGDERTVEWTPAEEDTGPGTGAVPQQPAWDPEPAPPAWDREPARPAWERSGPDTGSVPQQPLDRPAWNAPDAPAWNPTGPDSGAAPGQPAERTAQAWNQPPDAQGFGPAYTGPQGTRPADLQRPEPPRHEGQPPTAQRPEPQQAERQRPEGQPDGQSFGPAYTGPQGGQPPQGWNPPPARPQQRQERPERGRQQRQQQPPPPPPTVEELTTQSLIRGRRDTPQTGWRKAVYTLSAHAVNPGMSSEDRRRQEMIMRATVPVQGCYRIAVISLKGGVGKTTTTVTLGATLASLRGDRVIAVDANPDRGTLSGKIPLETVATVRNLLNDSSTIHHYFDVRRYTSQSPDRLEVLASESDPAVSTAFSEQDYRTVAGILERFYNIVLTDCGTGLLHSAMAGVLDLADQIVLVSSGSVDGARSASATLDWLEAHGRGELVRNSVAVINSVRPKSGGVDLDKLEAHFAARCRAVTRIPYDPHLEEGAEVDLGELRGETRASLLELAAYVADAFPRAERPLPRGATGRPRPASQEPVRRPPPPR